MRIGIIDFGTNTLRLDIFETEGREYRSIYDFAIYSKIVENTVGSSLSQDGIEHIIQSVEEHQQACRHFRCDRIECFSTASLRYIDNADIVIEQVYFRSGIRIKMIDGNEESNYDYLALKSVSSEKCGVGCDLGGGSLQVFTFNETGALKSESFPFGSSRTAKRFSKNAIPSKSEILNIKKCVVSSLEEKGFSPFGDTLFAMGGTAKAILKLFKREYNKFTVNELDSMVNMLISDPQKALELIEEIAPNRKATLVPGMAVLLAVMEQMDCSSMVIHSVGVREGFMESILNGDEKSEPNILDIILGSI